MRWMFPKLALIARAPPPEPLRAKALQRFVPPNKSGAGSPHKGEVGSKNTSACRRRGECGYFEYFGTAGRVGSEG